MTSIYDWRSNNIEFKLREPYSSACYECYERETHHCYETCSKIGFSRLNIPETKLEKQLNK